jgi:hypothetical protein
MTSVCGVDAWWVEFVCSTVMTTKWNSITHRRAPFRCLSNCQVKENCPSDKTALYRWRKQTLRCCFESLVTEICAVLETAGGLPWQQHHMKIFVHFKHFSVCVCVCVCVYTLDTCCTGSNRLLLSYLVGVSSPDRPLVAQSGTVVIECITYQLGCGSRQLRSNVKYCAGICLIWPCQSNIFSRDSNWAPPSYKSVVFTAELTCRD